MILPAHVLMPAIHWHLSCMSRIHADILSTWALTAGLKKRANPSRFQAPRPTGIWRDKELNTQYEIRNCISRRFFWNSLDRQLVALYSIYQTYIDCMSYMVCSISCFELWIGNREWKKVNPADLIRKTGWYQGKTTNIWAKFEKTKPIYEWAKWA